jgi:hypothetical protein
MLFDISKKIKKNERFSLSRANGGFAQIERIARGKYKNLFRVSIIGEELILAVSDSFGHPNGYLGASDANTVLDMLLARRFKPSPSYYESDFIADFLRSRFPGIEVLSESELAAKNAEFFVKRGVTEEEWNAALSRLTRHYENPADKERDEKLINGTR